MMRHEETLDFHSLEDREYDQMLEVCKTEFCFRTIGILGWVIFCCTGALLCLAVSLTSTHQVSITHSPTSCDSRNVSRHCQVSPGGKYRPQLRTTGLIVLFRLEFTENSFMEFWTQFLCSFWPLGVYRKGNVLNTFLRLFTSTHI